jgi:ABC-type glycerol-3-phosphate transport system permease component
MVLCTGLIKAIPADLYEASAIAGAGPLTNFFKITAPLIIKPLTPLLISSFAFNFNNFVLIALLTGAPWPRRWADYGHLAVAGVLVNGLTLAALRFWASAWRQLVCISAREGGLEAQWKRNE